MKRLITMAAAMLALGVLASSGAQEGHPLKGSWLGEWQGNTVHGDNILLILDWDGKAITGMINPGTDNMPLSARVARAERLGRQARGRRQGQGRQRRALRHRRQAREPRAAESLDQRHVVEQQRPRHVHGEPAMKSRSVAGWCVGLGAAFAASLAAAHHAIVAKFDDTKSTGAARHRDERRLAQSARARVRQRHARRRQPSRTGPSSSRAPCCCCAAAGSTTRCSPAMPSDVSGPPARDGSRQVWGETVIATATNRQVYNVDGQRADRRALAATACAARLRRQAAARRQSTAAAGTGPIRRAPCCSRPAPTCAWTPTACSHGSPTRRASRRFNRGRLVSTSTASSGTSPTTRAS